MFSLDNMNIQPGITISIDKMALGSMFTTSRKLRIKPQIQWHWGQCSQYLDNYEKTIDFAIILPIDVVKVVYKMFFLSIYKDIAAP